MSCPFYEEIKVSYCKAYPVKKMVPLKSIEPTCPCFRKKPSDCAVYMEYAGKASVAEKEPVAETLPTPAGECVWMCQEVLSFRLCTLNYECDRCQFEQMIQDRGEYYAESSEIVKSIEKLKKMPGPTRKCKYMLLGKVSTEPCYQNYECWRCATYQRIKENIVKLSSSSGAEEGEENHAKA